jgi:diaminohydroxyphosphoribosylaminopyrimidine deaminase/5-amino-6-(5-phosphoribosylamino)uracil reductase
MSQIIHQSQDYMNYALQLARRGLGVCAPNPSVGCVIVKNGQIIAAEHTAANGRPHAESQALENAVEDPKGADVYVTLEPCAHHGLTPPCAEALVKAGVKNVYIAQIDPDPRVAGKGAKMLAEAGIGVAVGMCYDEAEEINRGFFKRILLAQPFVTAKIATDADRRYLPAKNGKPQWVTGETSRKYLHLLRSYFDVILTSSGTAIADNPQLNCRLPSMEDYSPQRVLIDRNLRTPISAQLFQNPPLWVFTAQAGEIDPVLGVKYIQNADFSLQWVLQELSRDGINNVLVEAGPSFVQAFMRENLLGEILWFKSAKKLGAKAPLFFDEKLIENFHEIRREKVGDDELVTLRVNS